jgi:hypothetical protein
MKKNFAVLLLVIGIATPSLASSVSWDGRLSEVQCSQFPGKFTLGENQKVEENEIEGLCGCISSRFREKGWELDTFQKISAGEQVNPLLQNAAIARFGKAVNYCSAGKYLESESLSDKDTSLSSAKETDQISYATQQILGFLGGGPLGIIVSPMVYNWVSGNLILWFGIGLVVGSIMWSFQAYLLFGLLGLVAAFISGKSLK